MRSPVNPIARIAYGFFGTLAISLGLLVLLNPAVALPAEEYSPLTAHLIREQGAEGVFIGLVAFWCLYHFEQRRPIHLALLLFTALFASVHWLEYLHGRRSLVSPVLNSLPFLLFLVTAPFAGRLSPGSQSSLRETERGKSRDVVL